MEIFSGEKIPEVEPTLRQLHPVLGKTVGRFQVGKINRRTVTVVGQEEPRFFKTLSRCCVPVADSARIHAEVTTCLGIGAATDEAERCSTSIGEVNRSAGKYVHSRSKNQRRGSAEQERLNSDLAVSQDHHSGRFSNRYKRCRQEIG